MGSAGGEAGGKAFYDLRLGMSSQYDFQRVEGMDSDPALLKE